MLMINSNSIKASKNGLLALLYIFIVGRHSTKRFFRSSQRFKNKKQTALKFPLKCGNSGSEGQTGGF